MFPRSPAVAARGTLLGALALTLALGACGGGRVGVTPAPSAGTPACASVGDAWPATVGGRARVATTSASPAVAAWGDPAIIARCGVPVPEPTTADCITADGIDWVARTLDDGMAFTTYGRDPAIEVLIPGAYAPEPLLLSAFASAAGRITQGSRRCT